MADSLVLTGVKDIKKHTGTDMLLTRPKRGGDTHSVKEWWKGGGVSTCYVECTVFDVTNADGTVKLVLDTNVSTNIRIDVDDSFNFSFLGVNEVRRGALFTDSFELIEHYVFPSISGGKVMTVTPASGPSRPAPAVVRTFTSVNITGPSVSTDGGTETYAFTKLGDATDVVFTLTSDDSYDAIVGTDVTFSGLGERILTLTGVSASLGKTKTKNLTVTVN